MFRSPQLPRSRKPDEDVRRESKEGMLVKVVQVECSRGLSEDVDDSVVLAESSTRIATSPS